MQHIHNWSLKKEKNDVVEQIFKNIIQRDLCMSYIYVKTLSMPRERTPEWSTLRDSLKLLIFKMRKETSVQPDFKGKLSFWFQIFK